MPSVGRCFGRLEQEQEKEWERISAIKAAGYILCNLVTFLTNTPD